MNQKPKNRILEPGMEGEDVLRLQVGLRALGIYKGETTGIFDKTMEVAISDFQKKHSGKQRNNRPDTSSKAAVDQKMADAITSEYELLWARRKFGVSEIDKATVFRLQKAGIAGLDDVIGLEQKTPTVPQKRNPKIPTILRQMAEIAMATGLSPENVHALVEVGKINSIKKLQLLSEKDLRRIFTSFEKKNKNGLSNAGTIQRELFLTRWKRCGQRDSAQFHDLRSVFPDLKATHAEKLAKAGIIKGSDLRSKDLSIIASKTRIKKANLDTLRNASELTQIRGITPKVAHALVTTTGVAGIEKLAKLDRKTFVKKIDKLEREGKIETGEAKFLRSQSALISEEARAATCNSDLCSKQAYFDYLLEHRTQEGLPLTGTLDQRIDLLQEELFREGKYFGSQQEWCADKQRKHYPENGYQIKSSLISSHGRSKDMSHLLPRARSYIQFLGPETVANCLSGLEQFMLADADLDSGHAEFNNLEFARALSSYDAAEAKLLRAVDLAVKDSGSSSGRSRRIDTIDSFDELLVFLIGKIENAWGLSDYFEPTRDGRNRLARDRGTDIVTEEYRMLTKYQNRKDYSPNDWDIETTSTFDEFLQIDENDLSATLSRVPPLNLERLTNPEQVNVSALGPIAIICNRVLSLILHYLCFLIPICKGDVYLELGNYERAQYYYDLVFDINMDKELYPYLNPKVEIPLIRIRHGVNLLSWAESLYRENTLESIKYAKYLYEKVLDIHDNYIPHNEDLFVAMDSAVNALLKLNFDNLSKPSALSVILDAVANVQQRSIPIEDVIRDYRKIDEITHDLDSSRIARELGNILELNIHFSSSRQVFTVIKQEGSRAPQSVSGSTLADAAISTTQCRIPVNPVIETQFQKARMRLAQIKAELNFLGYKDEMVPILRFSYLVNQAKMFVQLAVQSEKDFIQFLTNAEQEGYSQLTAQQALAIAKANLQVERTRANVARQRIELAYLEKAKQEQEILDLQAEIEDARDPIFEEAEWAQASDEYASNLSLWGVGGSGQNNIIGGAMGNTMGTLNSWTSSGDWKGWLQDPVGSVLSLGGEGEAPIETRRKAAAQARLNQIRKLRRQAFLLQYFGMPIAQQQIEIAVGEYQVTQRQIVVAQLQVAYAQQIISFIQTKFLNMELWYELAKEIRVIYRKLLDYAISTSFLAEQALEYELNQRLNIIRFDYYKPNRQGLLGAETLQADIATLEYQRTLLTEKRKMPVKAVVSLGEEYPLELLSFTSNGRAHFTTDFSHYDLLYPGAYQSRISRVEVVIEGLVPPEGVRGTLSTSGVSYLRTRENQIQPLTGNPETMLLSSYTIRGDQVVFYKTGEELELFEGLGVVTDWTLEMPKEANNMNYQTITDIKLVIYYTAFFDDDLRNLVLRRKPKGGAAYRGFSIRSQFPDGFYLFNNKPVRKGNKYIATLNFDTSDIYFPTNQEHRRIVNLSMVLASSDTSLPTNLPFQLSSKTKDLSEVVKRSKFTRQDGFNSLRASSNVGTLEPNGTPARSLPLNTFSGLDLNRQWELQITLDTSKANIRNSFFRRDEAGTLIKNESGEYIPDLSKIGDILFFVEYTYDRTDLTIAEHFDKNADHWQTAHHWTWDKETYRGSVARSEEVSRLNIDKALAHHPTKVRGKLKRSLVDNVMISFRTKLSAGASDGNDARFYFANGYYLLSLGREGQHTRLWKLSVPFDSKQKALLKETSDQKQAALLKPDRWYTVDVGKFGGHIDVSIDGAQVFDEFDPDPKDDTGIAVGTTGTGQVYFDDILI